MHFHTLLSEELQESLAFGRKVGKAREKRRWRKSDGENKGKRWSKSEKY